MNTAKTKVKKPKRKEATAEAVAKWVKKHAFYNSDDMLLVPQLDANGNHTKWRGPSGESKREKPLFLPLEEDVRKRIVVAKIPTGAAFSKTNKHVVVCEHCFVPVSVATKSTFCEHFGIGNMKASSTHVKKVLEQLAVKEGQQKPPPVQQVIDVDAEEVAKVTSRCYMHMLTSCR